MKKFILAIFAAAALSAQAGITTYTFTSAQWASKQGTTPTDGTTDGWISDKAGSDFSTSYQLGVKVTAGYSGAGAHSVRSFRGIRRVTFNYATTTSGRGSIRLFIGNQLIADTAVTISTTNCELAIPLSDTLSGPISFAVQCTKNSIWVHQVIIRSEEGVSPEFTESRFQLVTDIRQLHDLDQIIFGVADGATNKIMGYFDETVSQNNIHAIPGQYSDNRTIVASNDDAIYTLHQLISGTDTTYVFQDELRYETAYLVASGGRTKNRLALWDQYTSPTYGNYGIWRMQIAPDGKAVIESQGSSLGRYIQFNAKDQLFGCYQNSAQMTSVCLYREVAAPGTDRPLIIAPMVNFGEIPADADVLTGSRTITVNAIHLTEDIQASLRQGNIFSLSATTLDRDGDNLTIRYHTDSVGFFRDTLDLQTPDTSLSVSILLRVTPVLTISEAVHATEYASVYLHPVEVTKKFDTFIYIRDTTGSMLIYDTTDPNGKPYGQGLKSGDVLQGVHGRFHNYYGVPELSPVEAWHVGTSVTCLPDSGINTIDSTDVCRYLLLDSAVVSGTSVSFRGSSYPLFDKFRYGSLVEDLPTRLTVIVSYDYDVITLYPVAQQLYPHPSGIYTTKAPSFEDAPVYDVLGRLVGTSGRGILLQPGKKILR